ncbi:peptidase M23 [Streptomyces sp. NBC_00078]|uniref:peptidase M23 n=1 Tax=Streptomyces sp. NBC_00078 TaxID=2975643 RepID=UPI002254779A|nr:peptidase M23 [Streptomyces sp. NBC_00078]MCX5426078.1 peptidase M23 [Streptomyces sp. NBC_00078]
MEARDAARAAANLGGTALKLKAAGVAAIVFIVFLLVLGIVGAGAGGKAFADSCGERGQPGVDLDDGEGTAQAPGGQIRKDQIANAKIIDGVAEEAGLPGRATLIALMTALQESTLLNLDHGHLDSIGLFQQRPSSGWGTKADIMKPKYAARMFFLGDDDGSPRGLTDIKGWSTMDLGKAAQAVQASAHPDLYAGHEDAARQIAEEAGLDLNRAGDAGTGNEDQGDDASNGDEDQGPATEGECYPEGNGGKPGKPGAPFHDGDAPWPAAVKNPRSTEDAIAWAKSQSGIGSSALWYRACLAFTAKVYGWNFSGVQYAIDHYKEMPASMKHDKDRNPPPGALMYWDTGQRAGHVAVYLGDGKIASNDIRRPGYIDVVPATDIETKWGATYLGWAPPYFPKGG